METPWGSGIWGAPPEAQSGSSPKLLAEFAGSKHLLTLKSGVRGPGLRLMSDRCADNDPASVTLVSGAPNWS